MDKLIILGLATWRLSSLIVNESGPFDLFAKVRHALGVRFDERSEPYGKNVIANALTCVWCASMWIALLWGILFVFESKITVIIALPFAFSTIAIMIERLISGPG